MGTFANSVRALVKAGGEDWEQNLAAQEDRFRQKAPLSADIAMDEAARRLKKYQEMASMLGYAMRKARPQSDIEKEISGDLAPSELSSLEGSPGREIVFKVPEKVASWFDPRLLSKEAGSEMVSRLTSREPSDEELKSVDRLSGGLAEIRQTPGYKPPRYSRSWYSPAGDALEWLGKSFTHGGEGYTPEELTRLHTDSALASLDHGFPENASKYLSHADRIGNSAKPGLQLVTTPYEHTVAPRRAYQLKGGLAALGGAAGAYGLYKLYQMLQGNKEEPAQQKTAGPITDPIRHGTEDIVAELMRYLSEKKEETTKVTTDPSTHPAYYPALALGVPKAFTSGYQAAGKEMQEDTRQKVDTELEHAKKEFEQALSGEYDQSKIEGSAEPKVAAFIDGVAKMYVKEAEGELNQMTNMYLGLATLLGSGAFAVGHNWAEKHDKSLQELKAMREYLRRRAYVHPPVVIAEPEKGIKSEPAPVEDAATAAAV